MSPLEDCCYRCTVCDLPTRRDAAPSSCEDHGHICNDCAPCPDCLADDIEEGRLMARDYEKWAAL